MTPAWTFVDPGGPGWPEAVDTLWARLDPAVVPPLPDYFVKTTFVTIGGRLAAGRSGAVALLFPRGLEGGRRIYTLRMHGQGDRAALAELLAPGRLEAYDPAQPGALTYTATHRTVGGFDLGAPGRGELPAIRALHQAIWGGGDEARYPDDLHSAEFGPATSLVARPLAGAAALPGGPAAHPGDPAAVPGAPAAIPGTGGIAGFLLGFYRFGLPALGGLGLPYRLDLAVESQVMGVAAEARRHGLAATLKREQARLALARGLDLIHWTADPLQYPNAVLNFGKLRALAGEHYPAYYPFQNELNRVPASRLGLVWLPRSARGRAGLADDPRGEGRDLGRFPGWAPLNDGPEPLADPGPAPYLALEIPADWTALQRDDVALAARWRAASDMLLARHLGFGPGRHLIVAAAAAAARRYLVLQPYGPGLLAL